MLIIDKHKDYYDYHSHIYGVDKKVVFDRRGSIKIDPNGMSVFDSSYHCNRKDAYSFIVLEVGYTQYLLRIYNMKYKSYDDYEILTNYSLELIRIFKDDKHYYGAPISIRRVDLKYSWKGKGLSHTENTWDNYTEIINRTYHEYNNPIVANTKITSLIDSFDMWKEIQTYMSSLNNDRDISIDMNDKEKAETHGFDKHSFRNPIK